MIVRKVGRGGQAAVYEALDRRLKTRVAIKEMSDSILTDPVERQHAIERFRQEARMLCTLNHHNLARVSDLFVANGKHYLVMDFIEGTTLEQVLNEGPLPLPEDKVQAWTLELCDVLGYLHAQNPPIIFRDLKPSNIMIDEHGHIKLIDFGIARLFKPNRTSDTEPLGTWAYAAPEQQRGMQQSAVHTDIYALGVTLHQMLSGHQPTGAPPPPISQLNPHVSPAMVKVVDQALEHDPRNRWQSTSQITQTLTSAQRLSASGSRVSSGTPSTGGAKIQRARGPVPVPEYSPPSSATPRDRRPTTRLIQAVAQWSNTQIAIALGVTLVLITVGLWFGMPIAAEWTYFWNNFSGFSIIAPLVFAAIRKPWLPSIAHVLLVMVSVVISSIQMLDGDWTDWKLEIALLAALASGLVIEGFVHTLESVLGRDRSDAWRRELGWLCLMSVVASVLCVAIFWGWWSIASPLRWISAAVMGAVGWFLGDLVQQYFLLKQTGLKRRRR